MPPISKSIIPPRSEFSIIFNVTLIITLNPPTLSRDFFRLGKQEKPPFLITSQDIEEGKEKRYNT